VALADRELLDINLPAERPKARAMAAAAGAGSNGTAVASINGGAPSVATIPSDGMDMERYVADIERSLLQSALQQTNGVQTRAAEMLKLSYRSFRHLMKKYDI